MAIIEQHYQHRCTNPSDIYQHLPTLKRYAADCEHVTEFGVRTVVSTWAFLAGLASRPSGTRKRMVSVDPIHPRDAGGDLETAQKAAVEATVDFTFVQADDRHIEIETTDLLFIDTWHSYDQLKAELELHARKARRFIILHDTETYALSGEGGQRGIKPALDEFLAAHLSWRVREHFAHCNGLTVLDRDPNRCPRWGCETVLRDGLCHNYGCETEILPK